MKCVVLNAKGNVNILINRYITICLAWLCNSFWTVHAQPGDMPPERSVYVGAVLRSNGYGGLLGVRGVVLPTTQSMQLDVVTHRHPREIKIINPGVQNPKAYVYGKLYHTALTRLNWGIEKPLVARNDWNKLGLISRFQTGPVFAIQRPVYLSVYRPGLNDMIGIIRSERYDPDIHTSQDFILGYSEKRKGWDQLEYVPGWDAQITFDLQWSGNNGGFKSLRLGGVADYFPAGLPIMALTENPDFNFTLFLSLIWGS